MATKRRHFGKTLLRWLVTLIIMALVLEGLLRLVGITPYEPIIAQVQIEPSHYGTADSIYGFRLREGQYSITLKQEHQFVATHQNGRRVLPKSNDSTDLNIHFLGCSLTYGYGVDDDQSYPALLQHKRKNWSVFNHAVNGYGVAQFYLQLQALLADQEKPDVVVLGYAAFQDERGTMLRNWRKSISAQLNEAMRDEVPQFPYVLRKWFSQDFAIDYCDATYVEWPWVRSSSLMNSMEQLWNWIENQYYDSHKTSWAVLQGMHGLCKEQQVRFVVYGLDNDPYTLETLDFLQEQGVEVLPSQLDLLDNQYNLQPFDHHPNPAAHRHYVQVLEPVLLEMQSGS